MDLLFCQPSNICELIGFGLSENHCIVAHVDLFFSFLVSIVPPTTQPWACQCWLFSSILECLERENYNVIIVVIIKFYLMNAKSYKLLYHYKM